MSVVLATVMVAVALYCALRLVVPRWRDERHPLAVDLTHVVMGLAMAAMFLATIPTGLVPVVIFLFLAALGWYGVRCLRGRTHALFVRIGATCVAMLFMLSPVAASAHATGTSQGVNIGHSMGAGGHADATAMLATLMLFAMIAVSLDALIEFTSRPSSVHQRLSTLCEVSMSGAMAGMIATML